jgi:tryptophan-rich sensory protein
MNELASSGQLRMSFLRWALVTVPAVVLLGFLSARIANSGYGNLWFAALDKPSITPAGWVFAAAWTTLYILIALALAMVINARGARLRGLGIALFLVQLLFNLAWSPIFFAHHRITLAFYLILAMIALTAVTIMVFRRIRGAAALLMLPYLAWLCFAGWLNHSIDLLNPDARTLAVPAVRTQI